MIERAYDLLRGWGEMVVEQDLLQGVSQRFTPNIMMTKLKDIRPDHLPAVIGVIWLVSRVGRGRCHAPLSGAEAGSVTGFHTLSSARHRGHLMALSVQSFPQPNQTSQRWHGGRS